MDARATEQSSDFLIKRIDAIMAELKALREEILAIQSGERVDTPPDVVEQLYGSLGQGTNDDFHKMLDWHRFDQ